MKIIILGAGLIGRPMAVDLSADPRFLVTVADIDEAALRRLGPAGPASGHRINTISVDLSDANRVKDLVKDHDLVLIAVPGFMGFQTLKAVVEAGRNVVDISFFPEDPFLLEDLTRAAGVTAIVDCGVAPGMSNILAGYLAHELDEIHRVTIYVGGLPEFREWPYEYKAVFSPIDVIEEYVRPARYVENGEVVTKPALSDPELLSFPGIGTLEAFNTDGLRTLAKTIRAPHLKEKTLRYPGHIEKMAMLRETGFFSREEVQVNGARVRPLDFTAKLLFPKWKLQEGDRDITVMRVIVEGTKAGVGQRHTYDLLDRYDSVTRTHSMARTTGYTATVVLRMLAGGMLSGRGLMAPELIGAEPHCVGFLLKGLEDRGVVYNRTVERT